MSDYEQIHNRKELKQFRKDLRNNGTPSEATLWKSLQRSQLKGRKFRRQHSVGNYILDFYCPSERLCIELDGSQHYTEAGLAYDQERTDYLNSLNIRVVRFENKEVFEDLEGVLERICENFTTPSPS
ncbi:MAG: endonuclease domain-containing protein [Microscillaceae bacterium]|nr:endonuclease domain-containing protein [Microscillaceae bacterium]